MLNLKTTAIDGHWSSQEENSACVHQSERLAPGDFAWAILLGCAVGGIAYHLCGTGIPPEAWDSFAEAIGIRAPAVPFPGLWRAMVAWLAKSAGVERAAHVLHVLGPISLGVLTAEMFLILHEMLPGYLRLRMSRAGWGRWIVRIVLMQGAVFFACAEPVWNACRYLSSTTMLLVLSMAAGFFCIRGFRLKSLPRVYVSSALWGVLAAETPFGIVAPLALGVYGWTRGATSRQQRQPNPLANPLVRVLALRRMSHAFFAGLLPAAAVNALHFVDLDGLAAHNWSGVIYCVNVLWLHGRLVAFSASPVGWIFIGGVVVAPLLLASVLVSRATDEDKFLPYKYGIFFILAGLAAFMQLAGWRSFWFWNWTAAPCVRSQYLLCLCSLGSAVTLTLALCVLGVEIYFRNFRRIAATRYQDALETLETTPQATRTRVQMRTLDRVRRLLIRCEPIAALALLLPFRWQGTEAEMRSIVQEFAERTAEECGSADRLFTDGTIDAGVEVAAAMKGKRLKTISMTSGGTPLEVHLRQRAAVDEEDRSLLGASAADALRTWIADRPERMTNLAVQLGFEMWRHNRSKMPTCGGFVARPDGAFAPGEREAGVKAAHALADRILALHARGRPMKSADRTLKSQFLFAQWRIARMCRMRADALDAAGDTKGAMAETTLADRLDAKNETYARLRSQLNWLAVQRGTSLTAREGLRIGLERADFRLARVYAQQILASNPDDSSANFAIGMGYFIEEQYGRAEEYLKRSLSARPGEPVALNNLAITQMRQGRFAEAETNALKALKAAPSSRPIKQTLDAIREKIASP